MSEPIIIADGYSAEPYGDAYIISHRDGGRPPMTHPHHPAKPRTQRVGRGNLTGMPGARSSPAA